jgi:hypothetical protein
MAMAAEVAVLMAAAAVVSGVASASARVQAVVVCLGR